MKWFDTGKGFGFVTVWGWPEDIIVHAGVVRRLGLRDLTTGNAVAVRVLVGRCGRLAAEIARWTGTDETGGEGGSGPE